MSSQWLVREFVERIRDTVFHVIRRRGNRHNPTGERSEVYKDKNTWPKMKAGMWTQWNTPREYRSLDGTGRKLFLYDKTRGITVEVEIEKVKRTDVYRGYPWFNLLWPGVLYFFEPPIPLSHILSVAGFESFGFHKKDRSPYRNITHAQYRQLTADQHTAELGITMVHALEPAAGSVSNGESSPPAK